MPSEQYEFKGHNGVTLAGNLESPDGTPQGYAVFAHCFTCTKDFVATRAITQALAKQGIATLRFDFTGLGRSEGNFADTHFTSNVEDLICAAAALTDTHAAPRLMVGHSLGGAATLAAAPYIDAVQAVATIAAPFDPAHVLHLFQDNLTTICEDGQATVDLFGRPFNIKRAFIEDSKQQNQEERIRNLDKALLIMHAPTDQTVGIENAQMIYQAARHPKSFISLDGMEHLLMDRDHAAYTANLLSAWAIRYID